MRFLPILALIALAAPAQAGVRQDSTVLLSDDPTTRRIQEDWGFADAVVAGDTVYLSGVVVGVREGGDAEASFTRVFERIGAILGRAGASWDDAVEMTSYHTDLQSQMPVMLKVKKAFLKPPAIAWTAIEVTRLVPDRGIAEIRVIAKLPKAKKR